MFRNNIYKDALKKFAGYYVFNKIAEEGKEFLKVRGEVKELVVCVMKVGGWSDLSNTLSPREIVDFVNSYYNIMFKCISENKGIVNSIANDVIISTWGLTDSDKSKEHLACLSAIESQKYFLEISKKYSQIQLYVGIASGDILVGNFGSDDRLFNILIGDYVKLDLLLSNKSAHYKTKILISEKVKKTIEDMINVELVDSIDIDNSEKNGIFALGAIKK